MATMENDGVLDGFLLKEPRESSKGDQRIARFEIANHYISFGHKQFFAPVACYGKTADFVLDDADFRAGDLLRVKYKLKGIIFNKEKEFKTYACELIGNRILLIKRGKHHPEGGDETKIGLPEGV